MTLCDPDAPYRPPEGAHERVLFTDCTVRRLPGAATAAWLLVERGRVAALGPPEDVPAAHHVVHLDGAVVLPAFCDAHVHLPATGLYASAIDLRGTRAKAAVLDALRRAAGRAEVLFAGNFEDPDDGDLSGRDLDAAVGERDALVMRADMHSAVASTALVARLDLAGVDGVDRDGEGRPSGYLREEAAAVAWRWFVANLPEAARRDAVRAATRRAYAKGVAEAHEMHVVEWQGWASYEVLRDALAGVALQVVPYIATSDVERVAALGHRRIGGDWFLDGTFGSYTAWLSRPYPGQIPPGAGPTGTAYRSDAEVRAFFLAAQRAGMQVGVHAIGDAAIEQALSAWEHVAAEVGVAAVRALGHRIEHFECAGDGHIVRAARLGVRASVQPVFDLYWGGEGGMYARRVGWERAREMNRFETMTGGGLLLGSGSDSTVTPLDPLLQVEALRTHHLEEERAGRIQALRLVTMGGRLLARRRGPAGVLEPGLPADVVALDRDPAGVEPAELTGLDVLGTWIGGLRVHPPEAAEHA